MITQVHREGPLVLMPMDLPDEEFEKFLSDRKKKYFPLERIRINVVYIAGLLEDIEYLIFRIDWCHELVNNRQLDLWKFSHLVGLDIKFFHILIRSILDHIAQVIRYMGVKWGEIPDSFNGLFIWAQKLSNPLKKLGSDRLKEIILSAKWYEEIRAIRDNLIHYGASKFVKIEDNEIYFNIFKRTDRQERTGFWYEYESIIKTLNPTLYHGDSVNLKLYIAHYYVKLLILLEDLGPLVIMRVGVAEGIFPVKYVIANLPIIKKWIELLFKKVQA